LQGATIRRLHSAGVTVNKPVDRLPLAIAAGWGIGTLVPSIMFNTTAFLLLRYMTDYLGIAAVTAGLLITLSKVYDIVVNPIMGQVSDRSRFAAGRRRPWLLIGGGCAAAGFVMLFNAPDSGALPFVAVALLAYATGYTMFNVPYIAMPAEMTEDYHERSWLMSFRVYAIAVGTFAGGSLAPILIAQFGGGVAGHRQMAWLLAVPIVLAALVCYLLTGRARFTTPAAASARPDGGHWRLVLGNRPFVLLLLTKFLQLFGLAAGQATMSYFVVRVLGFTYTELGLYTLVGAAGIFLSQPLWLRLSRALGKSRTYAWAAAAYAALTLSWFAAGAAQA
jgi:GPH family glycoside/pentoside/hexuronide:cation symporter